ncbi:hypothetical protein [Nocardia asteroides]|uniref:hypothetical protein n=1 Tax=Nocardia asteroides TaxID=1824 RepID=UPI001E3B53B9|nr:hypothetical protein [Nocardia asteroides]UGT62785.1 hypothetical protein LTT61_05450 [Nocardia asteroides]
MQQVAQDLIDKVEELGNLPARIRGSFEDAAGTPLVRFVLRNGDDIIGLGNEFADAISELWEKFVQAIEGVGAPIAFIETSYDWVGVTRSMNTMAADLEDTAVKVGGYWQGAAAESYADAITPQRMASARMGSIATAIRSATLTLGIAGVTFYTSLLAIVISVIVEAVAECLAAGTGIGAIPAGIAGLITAAKFAAMVTAAISGIFTLIQSTLSQVQAVQVELENPQGFPHGHWPSTGAAGYADATVLDGDADWSVKPA